MQARNGGLKSPRKKRARKLKVFQVIYFGWCCPPLMHFSQVHTQCHKKWCHLYNNYMIRISMCCIALYFSHPLISLQPYWWPYLRPDDMKLIPWQRTELLDVCNHADDYYSSHIVSYIGCTGWEYNFSVILPFGLGGSLCILGTAYNVSSK